MNEWSVWPRQTINIIEHWSHSNINIWSYGEITCPEPWNLPITDAFFISFWIEEIALSPIESGNWITMFSTPYSWYITLTDKDSSQLVISLQYTRLVADTVAGSESIIPLLSFETDFVTISDGYIMGIFWPTLGMIIEQSDLIYYLCAVVFCGKLGNPFHPIW